MIILRWFVLAIGLVCCVAVIVWMATREPTVNVSVELSDKMTMHISTSRVNGLRSLSVVSKTQNDTIWEVFLGSFQGERLVLGELPPNAEQITPNDNKKLRLPKAGEDIVIITRIQYDQWFSAFSGARYFQVRLPTTMTPVKANPIPFFELKE